MIHKAFSIFLAWLIVVTFSPGAVITVRGPRTPAAGGGLTAPTFISATLSNFTDVDTGNGETTASVSWNSGDLILIWGITENTTRTIGTPTATGLTFSQVDLQSTASDCNVYLFSATAGSTSSSVITATTNNLDYSGLVVQVWRGSGGLGTPVKAAGANAQTISLTRVSSNSCVAFAAGDWNANTAASSTASPTGTKDTSGGNANYGYVVTHYGSQGATGTTSYGVSGWTGTLDAAMMAVEVKGL